MELRVHEFIKTTSHFVGVAPPHYSDIGAAHRHVVSRVVMTRDKASLHGEMR